MRGTSLAHCRRTQALAQPDSKDTAMAVIVKAPSLPKPVARPVAPPSTEASPPSLEPLPYRGDWWGLLVWLGGAGIIVWLHVLEIYRAIVGY
jgi:hypothetical protein